MRRSVTVAVIGSAIAAGISLGVSAPASADVVIPLGPVVPNIVVPLNVPGLPNLVLPELPKFPNCPPGRLFIIDNGRCIAIQ